MCADSQQPSQSQSLVDSLRSLDFCAEFLRSQIFLRRFPAMAEFLRLGNRDHLAHALLGQSKRGVSLALWLSLAHRDRFYDRVRGATSFLLVACSQVLTRGGVHSFGVETSDRRCLHFKSTLCASRAIEAGSRGTCPSHMVPFGRGDLVPLPPAL